ncbi:MAG: glycerate kinase [Candidatus Didemnitutus sp.]|nr:glycerate kinase [Candidatus Didemnitutus sp.]
MKILIAPDKFKDALSAADVGETIRTALAEMHGRKVETDLCPLTDGGEGFAEILTRSCGGRMETVPTRNARGCAIRAPVGFARWGRVPQSARALLGLGDFDADAEIALVGMASASGLEQLSAEQRAPWLATTCGTGQLIAHARRQGARAVLLGIGGSATHDLGVGALQAMGCSFFDEGGRRVDSVHPGRWVAVVRAAFPTNDWPPIRIACDVINPLLGERGAARVYSVQKGLGPEEIPALEAATERMARLLCAQANTSFETTAAPSMGAAGGMAFGLATVFRAGIVEGAALVREWLSLEARIDAADLVITGEGRFDESSLEGKGPGSVLRLAAAHGRPVHFFAGAASIAPSGGVRLHLITPAGQPLVEALSHARSNLREAVRRALGDVLKPDGACHAN